MTRPFRLASFSPRGLSLVASYFAGQPTRVILSRRLEEPFVLEAERRNLYLDEDTGGLYDLILMARLMRRRPLLRAYHQSDVDAAPTDAQVDRWLAAERRLLEGRYPGIGALAGALARPDAPRPRLVWRGVRFRELEASDLAGLASGELAAAELLDTELSAGGDLRALHEAIARGDFATEPLPGLPEVELAAVPLRISVMSRPFDLWEDESARSPSLRQALDGAVRCFQQRKRSAAFDRPRLARGARGLRLDHGRLYQAALAGRTGRPPRVFRRPFRELNEDFDPRRSLVVLAFDANALASAPGARSLSKYYVLIWAKACAEAGISFIIEAYRDRLLTLPGGRRVYLHMPSVVKELDEPLGSAAWARLDALFRSADPSPEAGAYHPVQLRSLAVRLGRALEERPFKTIDLSYLSPRGLELRPADEERAASALERQLKAIQELRPAADWTLSGWIPPALKSRLESGLAKGFFEL